MDGTVLPNRIDISMGVITTLRSINNTNLQMIISIHIYWRHRIFHGIMQIMVYLAWFSIVLPTWKTSLHTFFVIPPSPSACGGDVPKTAICRGLRPAFAAVQGDPNGATTAAGAVIVLAGEASRSCHTKNSGRLWNKLEDLLEDHFNIAAYYRKGDKLWEFIQTIQVGRL